MDPSLDAPSGPRLTAAKRREVLLDVAKALNDEGGPANVTMGSVAERAEVTRALVYRHFANREEILGALYHRETVALDRLLRGLVLAAPDGFEPKLRAYVAGVLEHIDGTNDFFAPLRRFGSAEQLRHNQRRWDRRTVGYFAELAADAFDLEPEVAASAIGVLLSGVQSLLSQIRHKRSPDQRWQLEELYVQMAIGALARLADTG